MCPAGKVRPDSKFITRLDGDIKKSGVKLVDGYLDGPGHEFTFVLETDDISKLYGALMSVLLIGENTVTPVTRFSDAITLAKKLGIQE